MTSTDLGFAKINRNRYVTLDGRFTVINTGGSVWVVLQKNDDEPYNTLFLTEPFNSASEAMEALRRMVA